jgi:UDP-GlcNAc:undecaprenyl-phosphate GlcNAc-1-phosphate transferase
VFKERGVFSMFEDIGLLFFTVLILSLLFTPLSMRAAFYVGAVDQPVDRSVHLKPMPRLGGLGMVLSVLVGMAIALISILCFIATKAL